MSQYISLQDTQCTDNQPYLQDNTNCIENCGDKVWYIYTEIKYCSNSDSCPPSTTNSDLIALIKTQYQNKNNRQCVADCDTTYTLTDQDGICYIACPDGTSEEPLFYQKDNTCVKTCGNDQYANGNANPKVCTLDCQPNYHYTYTTGDIRCTADTSCTGANKQSDSGNILLTYMYQNECIQQCETGKFWSQTTNQCYDQSTDCPSTNLLILNDTKECINQDNCPDGYNKDTTNVDSNLCIVDECYNKNYMSVDNVCVADCSGKAWYEKQVDGNTVNQCTDQDTCDTINNNDGKQYESVTDTQNNKCQEKTSSTVECNEKNYYEETPDSTTCVTTCALPKLWYQTEDNKKVCISQACSTVNFNYQEDNQCVSACSTTNKYIDNGICSSTCGKKYVTSDTDFTCVNQCSLDAPKWYSSNDEKICMSQESCGANQIGGDNNECKTCTTETPYIQNNVCVSSCSDGYAKPADDTNKICNNECNFKVISQEPQQLQCISSESCQDTEMTSQYSETRFQCVTKCSESLQTTLIYVLDKQCVANCGKVTDSEQDKLWYINAQQDRQCVDSTSCQDIAASYLSVEGSTQCVTDCTNVDKFQQDKQCVSACTGDYAKPTEGKVCSSSCTFIIVSNVKECVADCTAEQYSYTDSTTSRKQCSSDCMDVSGQNFISGQQCKDSCNDNVWIKDGTKQVCQTVTDCTQLSTGGKTYEQVGSTKECREVTADCGDKYYEESTSSSSCLDTCDTPKFWYNTTDSKKVCTTKTCSEITGFTYQNGQQCVSECTSMTYKVESEQKVCKDNCGTSGTIYFEKTSDNKYTVCLDKCVDGQKTLQTSITEPIQIQCLDECPSGYISNDQNQCQEKKDPICIDYWYYPDSAQEKTCINDCANAVATNGTKLDKTDPDSKQCLDSCPKVFYQDNGKNLCSQEENCLNIHNTAGDSLSFYQPYDKQCVKECTNMKYTYSSGLIYCTQSNTCKNVQDSANNKLEYMDTQAKECIVKCASYFYTYNDEKICTLQQSCVIENDPAGDVKRKLDTATGECIIDTGCQHRYVQTNYAQDGTQCSNYDTCYSTTNQLYNIYGQKLQYYNSENNTCIVECQYYWYQSNADKVCTSQQSCQIGDQLYYLNMVDNQCVYSCNNYFYINQTISTCTQYKDCFEAMNGNEQLPYLFDKQCVAQCTTRYYIYSSRLIACTLSQSCQGAYNQQNRQLRYYDQSNNYCQQSCQTNQVIQPQNNDLVCSDFCFSDALEITEQICTGKEECEKSYHTNLTIYDTECQYMYTNATCDGFSQYYQFAEYYITLQDSLICTNCRQSDYKIEVSNDQQICKQNDKQKSATSSEVALYVCIAIFCVVIIGGVVAVFLILKKNQQMIAKNRDEFDYNHFSDIVNSKKKSNMRGKIQPAVDIIKV